MYLLDFGFYMIIKKLNNNVNLQAFLLSIFIIFFWMKNI